MRFLPHLRMSNEALFKGEWGAGSWTGLLSFCPLPETISKMELRCHFLSSSPLPHQMYSSLKTIQRERETDLLTFLISLSHLQNIEYLPVSSWSYCTHKITPIAVNPACVSVRRSLWEGMRMPPYLHVWLWRTIGRVWSCWCPWISWGEMYAFFPASKNWSKMKQSSWSFCITWVNKFKSSICYSQE
jgi:hypothetical protein